MFGNIFYHQTMRKTVAVFGTLFNDISIVRRDKTGKEIKRIKVPLAYGPKERYLARTEKEPDFNQGSTIELPRLAFQIVSFNYDGSKKLNTMHRNRRAIDGNGNQVDRQFNPVAYKLGIELYVLSKFIDDGNQIVEQILPWFTPDYTVTTKAIPALQLIDDVPVTLQSVNMTDNYEEDWLNRRDITWTLNFEVKVNFYGPIKPEDVITKAQVDFLVPPAGKSVHDESVRDATPRLSRYTLEPLPGSTFEENFGYTDSYEDFDDNKKYNPETGVDENVVLKIKPSGVQSKEKFGTDIVE